jgi:AAHS family benzoate transporter-like MFS transporter
MSGAKGMGILSSAAVIVAALLGEYSLMVMPFIVTAMMQAYGVPEAMAGNLVSAQLVMMGIAGILVSYLRSRAPVRLIVVGSASLIIVANLLCAVGSGLPALEAGRCLTGLGEGALMASAGAIIAGSNDAHRLFSVLGFVIAGVAAAALILTPYLFDIIGPRGLFWLLTASPVAVLALARKLPQSASPVENLPILAGFSVAGATPLLFSFGLLWIGLSALWVFAELIGTNSGLSLAQVGTCLAIGQVAGILGPIAAGRYAKTMGLRRSIMMVNILMAVAGTMMIFGRSAWLYTLAVSALSIGSMYLSPCYRSQMAEIDSSGRVVATSVAFYTFGFALAPALVGVIHRAGSGYGDVNTLATIVFVVSAMLILVKPNARGARA